MDIRITRNGIIKAAIVTMGFGEGSHQHVIFALDWIMKNQEHWNTAIDWSIVAKQFLPQMK